ncbi:MAG: hypothetical protein AAF916_01865 [Planctomycetota bacterium]
MTWCVHLHVCFAAQHNDSLKSIAEKHLPNIPDESQYYEASEFLKDLSARTGEYSGPRGGLCLWGMVSNHTKAQVFVEVLKPFWIDLLSDLNGGPLEFERVIVFYEEEQSKSANCYEIGWNEEALDIDKWNQPKRLNQLLIRHHRQLPFSWNQH